MNQPVFLVKVEGESISCLGSQLLDILATIMPYVEKLPWYAADVEVNGSRPFNVGMQGFTSHKVGDVNDVVDLCKKVDQFKSGVFYQIAGGNKPAKEELSTEDEEFRIIPNAVLEIRAFDTTYFEVYTSNELVVNALRSRYTRFAVQSEQNATIVHLLIPPSVMCETESGIMRLGKASLLSLSDDKK